MAYKITIVRIDEVVVTVPGEMGVIDRRPYTADEVDAMSSFDRTRLQQSSEMVLKPIMGQKPDREEVRTTRTDVYEQLVDDLDLVAVIEAINGM